jgi:hypothetical protein
MLVAIRRASSGVSTLACIASASRIARHVDHGLMPARIVVAERTEVTDALFVHICERHRRARIVERNQMATRATASPAVGRPRRRGQLPKVWSSPTMSPACNLLMIDNFALMAEWWTW